MEEYSNADILNLFYIHGECYKVLERTCRVFNERYPHLPPMNKTKFKRIETNFSRFGRAKATKNYPKPITGNENNIINTLAYFYAQPQSSIPSAEVDLGISASSVQRILNENHMHPYSYQNVQSFKPGDNLRRIEFCEFMMLKMPEDPQFLSNIIWTDESKFSREGITNRRNQHFWATENPQALREVHFQDKFSFNVFAILLNNRVRYFIYDDNLNSDKYLEILRETVTQFIEEFPIDERQNFWYQLDGAPAHSSEVVYLELCRMFEDRWIGPNGPWRWPPRSPDLTPLDFYLWGYIKSKVYFSPVNTREELLERVRLAFADLENEQIQRTTTAGVPRRIERCLQMNGQHIEHLL